MVARLLLPLLLWVATAAPAWAQSWNYSYQLPRVETFRSLEVDVAVEGELAPGQSVYIAPFGGKLAGASFYFGLQTDLFRGGRSVGKGVIFSRWGGVDAADARPAPGGWADTLTHAESREGSFTGLRLPHEWPPGRYTFRLEAKPGNWAALTMTEHATGRRVDIGALRFPAQGRLSRGAGCFVEFYGAPPGARRFTVRFGPPRVNDTHSPIGGQVLESKLPAGLARITPTPDGGVTMQVGAP